MPAGHVLTATAEARQSSSATSSHSAHDQGGARSAIFRHTATALRRKHFLFVNYFAVQLLPFRAEGSTAVAESADKAPGAQQAARLTSYFFATMQLTCYDTFTRRVKIPGSYCTLPAWCYLLAACLQALLASVVIFGWPSMLEILVHDGVFDNECTAAEAADTTQACPAQQSQLNLIFVIASSLTLGCSLPNGWLMDTYGVKVSALASAGLLFVAFGTMAATANGALPDGAYFAAFCILGVGQGGQLLSLFSLSNLFPGYESLVVGIINGMADSAIVVFLIFNIAVLQGGIDFWVVLVVHIAGPVLMAACFAVFLWPWRPVEPFALTSNNGATSGKASPTTGVELSTTQTAKAVTASFEGDAATTENAMQGADTPTEDVDVTPDGDDASSGGNASPSMHNDKVPQNLLSNECELASSGREISSDPSALAPAGDDTASVGSAASAETAEENMPENALMAGANDDDNVLAGIEQPKMAAEGAEGGPQSSTAPFSPKFPYANAPFKVQLTSPLYVYLCIFTVLNMFKFSFYLSSVDAHLNHLGQDGTTYTQIFSSLLPTGLVFVLVVGSVIDRLGLHVAVTANLALSILLSVVTLIPVLEVQVLGFVLFALFRAHLFTVLTSILAAEFTFGSFGRLIGIASLAAALVGLLNSPLFDLAVNTFDGDFTVANVILLALTVLLQVPFAVFYWRYRRAADAALFTEASVAGGFALAIPTAPAKGQSCAENESGIGVCDGALFTEGAVAAHGDDTAASGAVRAGDGPGTDEPAGAARV